MNEQVACHCKPMSGLPSSLFFCLQSQVIETEFMPTIRRTP